METSFQIHKNIYFAYLEYPCPKAIFKIILFLLGVAFIQK